MYKAQLFLIYIICWIPSIYGQAEVSRPESQNRLGVALGYMQLYAKDLNFSPLNYSGYGMLYHLAYERYSKNDRNRFAFTVAYSSDDLEASTPNIINPIYIYADVGLSFVSRLNSPTQRKTNYFLGAAYYTRVFYMDYDDQEAFSYTGTHGLSVKGVIAHRFNSRNGLRTSLSLPFVQLLARPPYNGIDEFIIENQDNVARILFSGKLASFNRYLAIGWTTDYAYTLNSFLDIGARFGIDYQRATEPINSDLWQYQLSAFVSFKF